MPHKSIRKKTLPHSPLSWKEKICQEPSSHASQEWRVSYIFCCFSAGGELQDAVIQHELFTHITMAIGWLYLKLWTAPCQWNIPGNTINAVEMIGFYVRPVLWCMPAVVVIHLPVPIGSTEPAGCCNLPSPLTLYIKLIKYGSVQGPNDNVSFSSL